LCNSIEIEYENPLYFCFTCNSIGHSTDHCKNDPANKVACERVSTKIDPSKQSKHVPKRYVVKDCSKVVTYDDPIILDISRSKKVETDVLVGDVWWAKPQVHGSTEVVKIEYRPDGELWI